MFWSQAQTYHSPIPELLERENVSLAELLEEEGLIQDTKSANGKLIEFLSHAEQISSLLTYIVEPFEPETSTSGNQTAEENRTNALRGFKFPYVSCEVLCCNVDSIMDKLTSDEKLLSKLFSVLHLKAPLNCVLAGYFSRVAILLYKRHLDNGHDTQYYTDRYGGPNPMAVYVESHPEILEDLISHIDNTSIAEVLQLYLGLHDPEEQLEISSRDWLVHSPVMERLMAQLEPSSSTSAQQNAAATLCHAVQRSDLPLWRWFANPAAVAKVFSLAFSSAVSVEAWTVCTSLLQLANDSCAAQHEIYLDAVKEMLKFLPRLKELLQGSPGGPEMPTPFGLLAPPLGSLRLKAVEVILTLLEAKDSSIKQGLLEDNLIQMMLDLFMQFPFNNMLHNKVLRAVQYILGTRPQPMLQHLLGDCSLVSWLIAVPEYVSSIKGSTGKRLRAGYLGHVTQMGNTLLQEAGWSEEIQTAVTEVPRFEAWASQTLNKRNENENTGLWSFGRPQVSRNPASTVASVDELDGISDEEEDADLPIVSVVSSRYASPLAEEEEEEDEYWPEAFYPNDTTSAFRKIRLGDGYKAESSSSSSSDDDPFTASPFVKQLHTMNTGSQFHQKESTGAVDGAVEIASDSDDETSMDNDGGIVGSSARVLPSDAGFSDFDDFGGFQAQDSISEASCPASTLRTPVIDKQNFSGSPNSFGADQPAWAIFPSATSLAQSPEKSAPDGFWDPFGVATTSHAPVVGSDAESGLESRQNPTLETNVDAIDGISDSNQDEDSKADFSSFQYWRQPIDKLLVKDLA